MDNWWSTSNPDSIKPRPWLHPAAVLYLKSLLTSDMTVIEHGCGGSTLWFAQRVNHVTAVDDDSDWVAAIMEETKEIDNIRIMAMEHVPTLDPADLLLIDGHNENRPEWMMKSKELVKQGGIIVLDNAEREHYQQGRAYLQSFCYPPTAVTAYAIGLNNKFVATEFYRVKGGENWI